MGGRVHSHPPPPPPCIFHAGFSIQNKQGCTTLLPVATKARSSSYRRSKAYELLQMRHLAVERERALRPEKVCLSRSLDASDYARWAADPELDGETILGS